MNKNKIKKFFTLKHRPDAGFTLVELVIVIAILAILSGVAVPIYAGYTTKAREAADQMIIAAANDALAAACMENKVDVKDVTAATISVVDSKILGLSSAETATDANLVDKAAGYFMTYLAENKNSVFKTPNINSLVWYQAETTFKAEEGFVDTRVVLSSGKTITISADDMEMIQNSTYADMGYDGVKDVIDDVGKSGSTLAMICGGVYTNIFKGTTLVNKLSSAMKAYGLIDSNKEAEINKNLKITNIGKDSYETATKEVANGLSMITAKYLAGGGSVEELVAIDLGNNSAGVIEPMASGSGGTKTVSAIAVQYALAAGFANSEAAEGVTIEGKTVSEYLASASDPIKAIDTVKALDAYNNNYVSSDPESQYQKDINGFVGTMSILGDNIGTIDNQGTIDINDYLANGVASGDTKDVLTGVLGE